MEVGNVNDKAFGDAARMIAIETWTVRLGNIEERMFAHIDDVIARSSAPNAAALAEIRAELVTRMEIAATQRQQAITHLVEIKRQLTIDGERIAANSDRILALEMRQLPLTPEEVRGVLATVTRIALVAEELLERSVGGS
jgi:hypothetical protein